MDLLHLRQVDNRRLVDGLPLFRGAQLAIDTTMVSPVRLDVSAQQSAEQPWTKQGGGRSGRTLSWRSSTVPPGWCFGLRGGETMVRRVSAVLGFTSGSQGEV